MEQTWKKMKPCFSNPVTFSVNHVLSLPANDYICAFLSKTDTLECICFEFRMRCEETTKSSFPSSSTCSRSSSRRTTEATNTSLATRSVLLSYLAFCRGKGLKIDVGKGSALHTYQPWQPRLQVPKWRSKLWKTHKQCHRIQTNSQSGKALDNSFSDFRPALLRRPIRSEHKRRTHARCVASGPVSFLHFFAVDLVRFECHERLVLDSRVWSRSQPGWPPEAEGPQTASRVPPQGSTLDWK